MRVACRASASLTTTSSRIFYEKKIAQEVDASPLGDEWAGYILRITGGNDKQGAYNDELATCADGTQASR